MEVLVVEGNCKETREERADFGIEPYHLTFKKLIKGINPDISVKTAFPADEQSRLPDKRRLQNFDGVLLTGSSLSVLNREPSVERQLNFAEDLFQSGVPIYGSCWGLQVATLVAGGAVVKSSKGLEIGVSDQIRLTEQGKNSVLFKGRSQPFQSLCIHYDEVKELPPNGVVLATNDHSIVQAATFKYKASHFFGVQYHPEFSPSSMAMIIRFLLKNLVAHNFFVSEREGLNYCRQLEEVNDQPIEIENYQLHSQEIKHWLNSLKVKV